MFWIKELNRLCKGLEFYQLDENRHIVHNTLSDRYMVTIRYKTDLTVSSPCGSFAKRGSIHDVRFMLGHIGDLWGK